MIQLIHYLEEDVLELMKSNSEDSQDHLHENNLSKGSQGRKILELRKTLNGHEREKYANTKNLFTRMSYEIQCESLNIKASRKLLE